jgi:hypothetical protein
MALSRGDREYTRGVELSVSNVSGIDMTYGHWAIVTGDHEVEPSDASGAGGELNAVVGYPIDAGDSGKAHFGGAVWARVDSAVAAGDHLAAPDSGAGGEAGVAESGGGANDPLALTDAEEYESSGHYYALVRY